MSHTRKNALGWILSLAVGATGIAACNDAGFRSTGKKAGPQQGGFDPNGNMRPTTSELKRPGWIDPEAKKDWKKIFDETAIGSNPDGNSPSSDNSAPGGGNRGPAPSEELLSGVDGVLWIPCGDDATKTQEFTADFVGRKGSRVRLSGEFCPASKAEKITVLFVIDHSGSMESALSGEGPNDPTSGSGCRRLDASKVLLDKYAALKSAAVRVGIVNFASQARIQVPISDIDNVKNDFKASTFCGMQPALGEMTNYEDAFKYARNALKDIDGPKVVYFITDGSPTTFGAGGRADSNITTAAGAGLKAAQSLRDLDELTINALFVGYTGGRAKDPRAYLEELTGDKNAVRVTKDADDLVKAAASLNIGGVKITKDDTKVALQNPTGESVIGLARLAPNPAKAGGVHIWVTDPFVLVGTKDQSVVNTLTATAKTSAGDSLKTVAKINFKQLD